MTDPICQPDVVYMTDEALWMDGYKVLKRPEAICPTRWAEIAEVINLAPLNKQINDALRGRVDDLEDEIDDLKAGLVG